MHFVLPRTRQLVSGLNTWSGIKPPTCRGLTAELDTGLSDVMVICRESKGLRKGAVIVDWPIAISSDTWLAVGIGMLMPMLMPDGLPVYKKAEPPSVQLVSRLWNPFSCI